MDANYPKEVNPPVFLLFATDEGRNQPLDASLRLFVVIAS